MDTHLVTYIDRSLHMHRRAVSMLSNSFLENLNHSFCGNRPLSTLGQFWLKVAIRFGSGISTHVEDQQKTKIFLISCEKIELRISFPGFHKLGIRIVELISCAII